MDLTIYTDTTGKIPGSDQIIGNIQSGTLVERQKKKKKKNKNKKNELGNKNK